MPDQQDQIIRENLGSFIRQSFSIVNQGIELMPNWHINLLAEALTEVTSGRLKRLIINMPPRYLKSLCVSVAWPAWLLGIKPNTRIIAASYSQILSVKHSTDCRLVITSDWYKSLFPDTVLVSDQNTKNKFITGKRGFRFATSVEGTVTGEGGNFIIVDDPHNPVKINSSVARGKVIEWFEQVLCSRLDDKRSGAIVIVMQRLHEDDLSGYLLRKNNLWENIKLPAIANKHLELEIGCYKKTREEGHILHAERENAEQLEIIRSELGDYAFAAQYQQEPVPRHGAIIKPLWIKRYDANPEELKITQSWDTAIKTGASNDYSVCATWGESHNHYYLLEILRLRTEYPELRKLIIAQAATWNSDVILIEDKASGQSLLQDLHYTTKLPLIPIKPVIDKVSRLAAVTPLFESGKVLLPGRASWLAEYERELFSFPLSTYDDQVDATSQFLNYARKYEYNKSQLSRV